VNEIDVDQGQVGEGGGGRCKHGHEYSGSIKHGDPLAEKLFVCQEGL
jgi:hypothetical protein